MGTEITEEGPGNKKGLSSTRYSAQTSRYLWFGDKYINNKK